MSASLAGSQTIILATDTEATLGGLTFGDDDLVDYDPVADTATLYFEGDPLFGTMWEDIDAVHVLSNGHIILSTDADATLGGLSFGDDDLVDYDPVADTATLYFDGGALFSNLDEDIDAVHVLSNGHIILSTKGSATLGGLSVGDDDLVDYDPVSDTWTTKAQLPTARYLAASAVINGQLHVVGCCCTAKPTLEVYDPATDTWASKAPMPGARVGFSGG